MYSSNHSIVLVTDNCPAHPPIVKPPKGYTSFPPPILTNMRVVYLTKNTTPYLQPLDQGIIRSFKALYRRHYAEYLVSYLNANNSGPPEINILQAIHLITSSWSDIPLKVIFNCWQEASIHSELSNTSSSKNTYDLRL